MSNIVTEKSIARASLLWLQEHLRRNGVTRTVLLENKVDEDTVSVEYEPTDAVVQATESISCGMLNPWKSGLNLIIEKMTFDLARNSMLACESPTIQFLRLPKLTGIVGDVATDDEGPLCACVRIVMCHDIREPAMLLRIDCMVRPKEPNDVLSKFCRRNQGER